MKINTDAVLLASLVKVTPQSRILDIGTGTGVISLMLAQRFPDALIDAVEIDENAARAAKNNFESSPFAERLNLFAQSFQQYFDNTPEAMYDLIVSNPPFYINSLPSPGVAKSTAKHADSDFFAKLLMYAARHIMPTGKIALVLPIATANHVISIAAGHQLFVQSCINVQSYQHVEAHRQILVLGKEQTILATQRFVIYDEPNRHSLQYQNTLTDFFTIF